MSDWDDGLEGRSRRGHSAVTAMYHEEDADLADLDGQTVAVIGYGNLGRSAALNLRDSGLSVIVGSREEPAAEQAKAEGFTVLQIRDAMGASDVLWLALPDEVIPGHLEPMASIRPARGSMVCFSSGYCLAYNLVQVPDDVDVVLLAPRMIGARIRTLYEARQGFYSYVSVVQDASMTATKRLLALAKAFGTLRAGALTVSATTEAALDLYVEQTVGPLLGAAVLGAFEVGIAHGIPAEALTLELYLSGEMAATWDSFATHGFYPGVRLHGHAAVFGGFTRLADMDQQAMKQHFAEILDDIASGQFARRFQEELAAGSPTRALIEAMIAGDDPMSRAELAVQQKSAPASAERVWYW